MVKIGVICEGATERLLLSSESFGGLLASLNIEVVQVINAEGIGNLLPHKRERYIERLEKAQAQVILILADLDENVCITQTKARIEAKPTDVVVIAVKMIESWFLASTLSMRKFMKDDGFFFHLPEEEINPFETITRLYKAMRIEKWTLPKTRLAQKMIDCGFDISLAAEHPNCASAAYFLKKLKEIGTALHDNL